MGDSAPHPPPVPLRTSLSPSPAPGTQIIPGRLPPADGRGLVPAVRLTYAAPGGNYSQLHFVHLDGCPNDTIEFVEEARRIVSNMDLRSFDLVENICVGILGARGCGVSPTTSLGCYLDRTTTLGFYTRLHSVEGSS